MDPTSDKKPRSALWVGAGSLLVLALAASAWHRPPDGNEHAALGQFVGRFHPLAVHLPIGLILLVALLEMAAGFGRWSYLRSATGLILGLAAASAIVTALDGWMLGWSGGYKGALVTRHMWGGIALAALCLITAAVRSGSARRTALVGVYRLLLLGTVVLLAWTSHEGGALTHGEGYLTETMPGRLRSLLGIAPPKPKPAPVAPAGAGATLYAARISPLFERSCLSCHGPKKVKGGLRLDTYALLMKGVKTGPPSRPGILKKVS